MAFESIPGIKIISPQTEQVFIIADYFSVFESMTEVPIIYCWKDIKAVTETSDNFVIMAKQHTYTIYKKNFNTVKEILRARAIIEGEIANFPSITYSPGPRVLPAKNIYTSCLVSDKAFVGSGVYSEREINSGSVAIMNARMWRFLWIIGLFCMCLTYIILYFAVGKISQNWLYFLPISAFSGFIISLLFYLACTLVAKFKYTELYRVDPATTEDITFVVCKDGFAAIESYLYTGVDLIPWRQASFFVETNYAFIILNTSRAIFWLPKRFFSKTQLPQIATFLLARMPQK